MTFKYASLQAIINNDHFIFRSNVYTHVLYGRCFFKCDPQCKPVLNGWTYGYANGADRTYGSRVTAQKITNEEIAITHFCILIGNFVALYFVIPSFQNFINEAFDVLISDDQAE
jgi:hypothetical protein